MSSTLYPVHCLKETVVRGEDGDQRNPSDLSTEQAGNVKKAVEDKKSSTTDGPKLKARPNIFDWSSKNEEIKAFRDRLSVKRAAIISHAHS